MGFRRDGDHPNRRVADGSYRVGRSVMSMNGVNRNYPGPHGCTDMLTSYGLTDR